MTLVESLLLASAPQEGPTKVDGTRKLEETPCVALLGPPEIRTGATVFRMAQHLRLTWKPWPASQGYRRECISLPTPLLRQDFHIW